MTSPCVFCDRLAAGQYDAGDRYAVTFEPLKPAAPGHRLFVSRIHVADALEYPDITARTMEYAAWWARRHGAKPCNLVTSAGPEATQTVFHLHIHLVPRGADDGLASSWPWT